jgi:hypothetical protein
MVPIDAPTVGSRAGIAIRTGAGRRKRKMVEEKDGPVKVPLDVMDGLDAIRDSGLVNMLDSHEVQRVADRLEYYAVVVWIHENRALYGEGVFLGFEAE